MNVPAATLQQPPRADAPAKLLTPTEVVELLGISLKTLYNWRTDGRGPRAAKVGKFLRYDPTIVAEYITAQTEPVQDAA